MNRYILPILLVFALFSCKPENDTADAYGNFETREIIVSSEANGRLLHLDVEEGAQLAEGALVGVVDTAQLHLRLLQLQARIRAIRNKTRTVDEQLKVMKEKEDNLIRERNRVEALLEDQAATPKQLDDINGQIIVLRQEMIAIREQNEEYNRSILSEIAPLRAEVDLIRDQISDAYIRNPVEGTVLVKLVEATEMVTAGKPLYRIGDMKEMELRAYISGARLPNIELGQVVKVRIDDGREGFHHFEGRISWIASRAEFTPKNIQTKDERVHLVYAFKVKVENDGRLKIGMPGEVVFEANEKTKESNPS